MSEAERRGNLAEAMQTELVRYLSEHGNSGISAMADYCRVLELMNDPKGDPEDKFPGILDKIDAERKKSDSYREAREELVIILRGILRGHSNMTAQDRQRMVIVSMQTAVANSLEKEVRDQTS